jgi:hypothetical protein
VNLLQRLRGIHVEHELLLRLTGTSLRGMAKKRNRRKENVSTLKQEVKQSRWQRHGGRNLICGGGGVGLFERHDGFEQLHKLAVMRQKIALELTNPTHFL